MKYKRILISIVSSVSLLFASNLMAGIIPFDDSLLEEDSSITFVFGGVLIDENNATASFENPMNAITITGGLFNWIFDGDIANVALANATTFNTSTGPHSLMINQFFVVGSVFQGFIPAMLNAIYEVDQYDIDIFHANILETSIFTHVGKTFDITGTIFGENNSAYNNSAWNVTLNYTAPVANNNGPGTNPVAVPEPAAAFIFSSALCCVYARKKKQLNVKAS